MNAVRVVRALPWYAIAIAVVLLYVGLFPVITDNYALTLDDAILLSHPLSAAGGIAFNAFLYLFLAGMLEGAVFVSLFVLLLPLVYTRGPEGYLAVVARTLEFLTALLLWGVVGDILWVAIARYKLYMPPDPVVEWFPFLPYASNIYDYDFNNFHGHLVGATTDAELFFLWAMIALLVWSATFATVRRTRANEAS